MKNQIAISFFGFFLLFLNYFYAQNVDNVVVQVTATHDSSSSKGAGVIIGIEFSGSHFVYVMTSWSLIMGNEGGFADDIQVAFRNKKSQTYSATVFRERADENLDLLVLEIVVPGEELRNVPVFELPSIKKGKHIDPKSDVLLVGHADEEEWTLNISNFVQKTPAQHIEYGRFTVTSISADRGYKGGPVFDGNGNLLGMITNYSEDQIQCVSMEAVQSRLYSWGVPANLLKKADRKFRIDPLWVGLLVGGAAIGTGYVMDLSSREKYDYYRDNVNLPSAAYPTTGFKKPFERNELYESAVVDRQIATALSIGGGVLILGGIIWHYSYNRNKSIQKDIYLKRGKLKFSPTVNSYSRGMTLGLNLKF